MPLSADQIKKLALKREQFILDREKILDKQVRSIQDKLMIRVLDEILSSLKTDEDGNIKNTDENFRLVSKMDKIYRDFITSDLQNVLKGYIKDINQLSTLNQAYFASYFKTKGELDKISKDLSTKINARLGINSRGGIIENSFLDNFIEDTSIRNEIKQSLNKAINSSTGQKETIKGLRNLITDSNGKTGLVQNYFKTFVNDSYATYDNLLNKGYADYLGFRAAIYAGTLIKTSRPFCRHRAGKVFTREEIQKFGTSKDTYGGYYEDKPGDFAGKNDPYNPFALPGGYECRHNWNWIPDSVAIDLRPELKQIWKIAA